MNSNETNNLEDFQINTKIKISILWFTVTLLYLYSDYFDLYIPQKTQGLVTGNNLLDSPIKLWLTSILLVIPAIMAILSIFLKPSLNSVFNIIVGLFFSAFMLFIAFRSIEPWRMFYVFYALVESTITILIVWHAYKWKKNILKSKTISIKI